ncbi:MAG: DUF5610 domain-containing protein [Candidatus Cloacimonetes bacterium]|nr:DUF5610 domain-containing protein [Candidatus Cloacimonadota bacterium]
MVSKLTKFQDSLSMSLEKRSTQESRLLQNMDSDAAKSLSLSSQDSFDFKLGYTRSMQILEGESRSQIVKAFDMEISISVSATGKLESSLRRESERASEEESTESSDPFSPENTAKRIVDFVRQALGFARKFGKEPVETEEQLARFAELQTNAVKEGFRQARKILGKMPTEVDKGVDNTYDLVMKGLDKLFKPKAEEDVSDEVEAGKNPAKAQFYSSQSFSLSFKLQVQGNGQFSKDELNDFVNQSFGQVQDAFKGILSGQDKLEFSPRDLFSKGSFSLEKMKGLLA